MEKQARNAPNEEFKNFEELTKKLLAVPKKEVDKKREAYQRKKNGNGKVRKPNK